MSLILQAIKSMFRGVYSYIDKNRTHYDTRQIINTPKTTVNGTTVTWGYIKVADSIDFNINDIVSLTRSGSDGNSVTNSPVSLEKWFGNAVDIVSRAEEYNGFYWGVYLPTQEDADTWWDEPGSDNPFTSGLYLWSEGDDIHDCEITYSFTLHTGELKKLDRKYLPDNMATVEQVEAVQTAADNAQTTAETAQSTADGKMDANNPVGTGSFSMGRANGSAVGENSFAFGNDTMATALNAISNGEGAVANFRNMKASGAYNKYDSYYEEIIASQEYSLPKGYYTAIGTTYSVSENGYVLEGTVSTMVQLGDVPVGSYVITKWTFNESSGNQTTGTTMYYVLSNVAYSTNSRLLTVDKYTLSLADADTKGKYVHIVGNGTSDTERSNAHTLDWDGNAWYAGDVYVGSTSGTNRDEGSKKLATEDKVTELAIKTPEEASVGQTIVVKSVDENGKPTEWEAVDLPGGGGGTISVDTTLTQSGKAADAKAVGDALAEQGKTIPKVFKWANSELPFTKNEISGVASGGGFVVNPTNFADGKTYFRYNAGATYGFRWTNPNPQKGSLTITMRGYSQYSTTMTTGVFVVYMDGTESRILLTHGETVTYTTDPDKTVDYIRGNYDFENWVLLDMDALSIVADYPAPAGTVKSVNGILPDENGNVQVPTLDGTLVEPAEDDIPKVFFGGALQQTKDEAVVPFRYISKTQDVSGYAEIKAQGNSSMSYPKKNQTVKLYKDEACTEKLKVDFKGWGKQNKFCFKANWIDLSHARNVVSARLWADVVKSRANYTELPELLRTTPNQGAMDGFPIKVYADGVYQGRYTLNIPKDKWAFNMDDELDNHCVLCGENYASGCFRAAANINESDWTDEIHDTVPASIKTRWNEVISFVMNSTDADFKANLGNYFDVDSLIDYHLFGLATCGFDAYGKNQLYLTYDGQKWIASMYDMDSTWGLYWNGSKFVATDYPRTSYEDFVSTQSSGEGNLLYIRLEALFYEELQARWTELRNDVMTIDNVINLFERFTDITPAELVKEDFASTTGGGKFTGIPSQSTNNIQQIRAYANARLAWTDEYVASLTGTGGEDEPDVPATGNYTALSYIEATGTQYIDTGVSGGTNAAYEIKMNPTAEKATNWEAFFCGAKPSSIPNIYNAQGNQLDAVASSCLNDTSVKLFAPADVAHVVEYKSGNDIYVDGTAIDTRKSVAGNGWGNSTWWVFNSHGEPALMSSMKLYYLKMWTDGELVRDFVPAKRNSDGAIGLYDFATNSFFENAGTGEFVSGEEVEPIVPDEPTDGLLYSLPEVTTFDGTNYIDTGVQLFAEDKPFTLALDWEHTGESEFLGNTHMIAHCIHEVSPYSGVCVQYTEKGLQCDVNQGSSHYFNSGDTDGLAKDDTRRLKIVVAKSSNGNITVARSYNDSGVVYTDTITGTFVAVAESLLLGCYQTADGTKGRFAKGVMHDCKVYNYALSSDEIEAYLIVQPDIPDAPTDGLLYSLPEATTFDGVDDYIDTGVKLFDEPKDFTILFYAYLDSNNLGFATVFHCINEVSPFRGLNCDMAGKYRICGADSGSYVTMIPTSTRTKFAIVANAGVISAIWYKGEGSEVIACTVKKCEYAAHDFNLLLGAYQDTSGTKGRFWKGALYDFRVYDYALTVDEVSEYVGGNPVSGVPIDNIEWSDTAAYNINSGTQISGTNYVTTKYIVIPDGATSVTLKNVNDSTFRWQGITQYTDILGLIEFTQGTGSTSEITVNLNEKARYVKFSAFPNNNEANIPATGLAVEFS